ncbi:MAG TPA: 4a-hydroxytetrahydrobiopterin dehydratase [Methylomirabilota bacterium]|nr:4a-hydroxytetrahydrobiopterin dehydratase [Methylomirabilota bacterium]
MKRLDARRIQTAMAGVPQWRRRGRIIHRTFAFQDFVAAVRFVNRVARAAEKAAHHPDIDIRWNKVRLALTTHDAGGLTEKDFALAAVCDGFARPRKR